MFRRPTNRRLLIGFGAVVGVLAIAAGSVLALSAARTPAPDGLSLVPSASPVGSPGATSGASGGELPGPESSTPTPRPAPGHEVFGYLPYWEMVDGIEGHVAATDLTTLLLFSVTQRSNGTLDTGQSGYKRIAGSIGQRLIRDAHARGVAVQLVHTSFGSRKNAQFFGSTRRQDAAIAALVALARKIGVDGINVDVEVLDLEYVPAYAAFVGRLRTALQAAIPGAQVSIATTANPTGAAMASAASTAGVDRVFMMAYDYHWPGSDPGASSPMARRDGTEKDIRWSLDLYEAAGVPVERTVLGLPLYGMIWPVTGPELGAPRTGRGAAWIPADNLDLLADPPFDPERDPIEVVDLYRIWSGKGPAPALPSPAPTEDPLATAEPTDLPTVAPTAASPVAPSAPSSGPSGSPVESASPSPVPSPRVKGWKALYLDSPETLAQKLALANDRGLAGAGFWAIGYERGLPGYTKLIARFHAGEAP